MSDEKKVALIILDGWGNGDKSTSDAIFHADTPFMDYLKGKYPNAELRTDGLCVGLPEGQMGNSEVGHLNIGAGRIVYQELTRINKSIAEGDFFKRPALLKAFAQAKNEKRPLHLVGLVSDGGVHSSTEHLYALCDMACKAGLPEVFIHAFTDGRDCNPKTGLGHIERLEKHISGTQCKIASVVGRYFAMDRDKRWDRVNTAYQLLVRGKGDGFESAAVAIKASYDAGITDEFVKPAVIQKSGKPIAVIQPNDVVICFNFRTDRCREITQALTQREFPEYKMTPLELHYVTLTNYDKSYKNVDVVFDNDNLDNTLGEVLSARGKTQLRIAETEKYPHVTYFFSGGRESEFSGEKRVMVQSPKVATYDLQPEMSAPELAKSACVEMKSAPPDFICLNFANTDMVGHTGVYNAILEAANAVDTCLKKIVEAGLECGYSFVIIADHGNSDYAINPDGTPNTAHSTNPVPVVVIDNNVQKVKNGTLRDVAPTILHLMGIPKPAEMTGDSLSEGN